MTDKILTEAFDKLKAIEDAGPEFASAGNHQQQKQFVVRVAWSQTDIENVLVSADSVDGAEQIVKEKLPGINQMLGASEIHIRL